MPGVSIQTAVRVGPNAATSVETSQLFAVGKAARGPVDTAKLVTSLEEFEAIYGGYASYAYLHPTIQTFFEEGGTRAYIARVAGSGHSTGSLTLNEGGVGGDDVMTITANGPGAWSSDITVETVNPGTVSGTFIIKIYDSGTLLYSTGNCTSVAQAVGRINSSAKASKVVVAADLEASGSPLPENSSATALSAGDDNEETVAAADYVTGLNLFLESYGTGVVVCPESHNTTVQTGLATHANAYNRIAFLSGAFDDTIAEAKTAGNNLSAADENAEHVAYFYPWVYIPTTTAGVNRLIPPVGYAAAKRAVAHTQVGAHKPGAGLISVASFVNGVATDIDKSNGDSLDDSYVNAIRVINNTIRVYGARSVSPDTTNFRYITAQDVVNQVVVEAYRSLEDLIFSVIDGRNTVFAAVESKLFAILEPLRANGALFEAFDANGKRIDFGYTVKCDASLNPTSQLADGLVKAKVGLRVSSVGDKIEVDIIKSNLTKSVV
jgi:hypothetical protein